MSLYMRAVADALDGNPPVRYAWVIDQTLVLNDDSTARVPDEEHSDDGITGPRDAPAELLARLAAGEGRQWRSLDEGDEDEETRVVNVGRYLHLDDGDELGENAFGPLDDWSQPANGAGEIQYLMPNGEWAEL